MPQYLTVDQYVVRTRMRAVYVTELETTAPGFIDAMLTEYSAYIDSLVTKRYATPFVDPPVAVQRWLTSLVDLQCWLKRGFNPTDDDAALFKDQSDTAIQEIKEAANAQSGLFELPLRVDETQNGIVKGFSRSYSEASPFVWKQVQSAEGRPEDRRGRGTTR